MSDCRVLIHISDRDKWSSALRQTETFVASDPLSKHEVVVLADIFAGAVCIATQNRR
jgi:hypothetical protein